ncbi:MAG: glycosyltransferase family 4 protein [Chloroflexi bacterium]|nr:glycosyltransferase family 4 protein [Chloroflexota bacterium]
MNARYTVGLDASRSTIDQPTGTELYSRLLIDALLERAPEQFFFRLYFNQSPRFRISHQRSTIRNMPIPRLWTQGRLSLEMTLHPPDVLFVPSHVLPIIQPRRSVVTVHDLGYLYFPETHPLRQRLYLDVTTRWHTRSATHVLADSEATKRDLIARYGARPDRITVAYPGLDPSVRRVTDPAEIARVKSKYGLEGAYVLYLGTLQPRKNVLRLIKAYRQSGSSWQLVLAGKRGWYYEQLIKQAGSGVRFIGYVDEADKAALLSGAKAFAFPSLYEGFGFPVLEAMACGVPVLCSNTSSLPEVAGEAALQVEPLNVDEIANGLRRITLDNELRAALIERGYRQAQRFTWPACADVVLSVFAAVLKR